MNTSFNFTKKNILAAPRPEKGKNYFKDTKEKGLSLYITSTGVITFFVRKRVMGRDERIILGNFPEMSIEEARKRSLVAKAQVADGKIPNEDKKKIRNDLTFKELFDRYIEDHAKHHTKSWQHDIEDVNRNLKHWFSRKISSITQDEIRKLHSSFGAKRGIYGANRLLDRINAIYNKAIEWGWKGINPAAGVKKFRMKSRDRFIQPNEMPFLLHALQEEENETARDYILISLMTGARKSNVLAMRWDQINWTNSLWYIPETKNGEPVTIPLVPQAIDILKARKQHSKGVWVFEGEGETGHLTDPKKAWKRVLYRATLELWKQEPELKSLIEEVDHHLLYNDNYGYTILKLFRCVQEEAEKRGLDLPSGLTDLRLHDIRRTLGSYQAITGASLPIIGKTLGHKSHQSTAIYARLNDDPVRDAITKATGAMFNIRKHDP